MLEQRTVALLDGVVALALDEPRRVAMHTWIDLRGMNDEGICGLANDYAECGAVGCVYGWGRLLDAFGSAEAVIAALKKFDEGVKGMDYDYSSDEVPHLYNNIRERGEDTLESGPEELFKLDSEQQTAALTLVECWPERFYLDYMNAAYEGDHYMQAQALVARIRQFVASQGEDAVPQSVEDEALHFAAIRHRSSLFHDRRQAFHDRRGRPYFATTHDLEISVARRNF